MCTSPTAHVSLWHSEHSSFSTSFRTRFEFFRYSQHHCTIKASKEAVHYTNPLSSVLSIFDSSSYCNLVNQLFPCQANQMVGCDHRRHALESDFLSRIMTTQYFTLFENDVLPSQSIDTNIQRQGSICQCCPLRRKWWWAHHTCPWYWKQATVPRLERIRGSNTHKSDLLHS